MSSEQPSPSHDPNRPPFTLPLLTALLSQAVVYNSKVCRGVLPSPTTSCFSKAQTECMVKPGVRGRTRAEGLVRSLLSPVPDASPVPGAGPPMLFFFPRGTRCSIIGLKGSRSIHWAGFFVPRQYCMGEGGRKGGRKGGRT